MKLGEVTIPCAVLEDKTRVLTMGEFLLAIGRSRTPKGRTKDVDELPPFLEAKNLQPYIDDALQESTSRIVFRSPKSGGVAYGYKAELLPAGGFRSPAVCGFFTSCCLSHWMADASSETISCS